MYAITLAASSSLLCFTVFLLGAGSPISPTSSGPGAPLEGAKHEAILSIALDCAMFDGKKVTVLGAAAFEFENRALCPTKEFLEADKLNCLWLVSDDSWPESEVKRVAATVQKGDYLVVDGTVACDEKGHGSLYGGGLRQVTFIAHEGTSRILWDASVNGSGPKRRSCELPQPFRKERWLSPFRRGPD